MPSYLVPASDWIRANLDIIIAIVVLLVMDLTAQAKKWKSYSFPHRVYQILTHVGRVLIRRPRPEVLSEDEVARIQLAQARGDHAVEMEAAKAMRVQLEARIQYLERALEKKFTQIIQSTVAETRRPVHPVPDPTALALVEVIESALVMLRDGVETADLGVKEYRAAIWGELKAPTVEAPHASQAVEAGGVVVDPAAPKDPTA